MRSKHTTWIIVCLGLFFISCAKKKQIEQNAKFGQSVEYPLLDYQFSLNDNIGVPSEQEVVVFFKETCNICHGQNEEGDNNAFFNVWPMSDELLTTEALAENQQTPAVYQALLNKVLSEPLSQPVAMPTQEIDEAKRNKILGVLAWMKLNMPQVIIEAQSKYGISDDEKTQEAIKLAFQCSEPLSGRQFANRLTLSTFDEVADQAALDLVSKTQKLDDTVSLETRKNLVDMVFEKNITKWQNNGLKNLATAISGSSSIGDHGQLTDQQVEDLKNEYFQFVLNEGEIFSYGQIFLENRVYASAHTWPLYQCSGEPPTEGQWKVCYLTLPAQTFFGTRGFLNAKRSSLLVENNNYGRVARMYFVLQGETFKAATNGPTGDTPEPMPDCLENSDNRHKAGGPRGTVAVPEAGNVCQSCHLNRSLAAGSVIMRPFSFTGDIYQPSDSSKSLSAIDPEIIHDAINNEWKYYETIEDEEIEKQVDIPYLESLLQPSKLAQSCVQSKDGDVAINSLQDLVHYVYQDDATIARGFARHAHRAFSQSTSVNVELLNQMVLAYGLGNNRINDLAKAYFMTETFTCKLSK